MSHDPDIQAISEEDIFAEAQARLKICTDAEGENRAAGILALAFEDGDQWDSDITNARKIEQRPALTINHTSTFVNRLINTLRQQRPRIKVHPVGDGADVESARIWNGVVRNIETLSNASVAYDKGVESAVKIGWGYWRIVSEYVDEMSFDQELKILPIRNPFTVYMDPSSVMPAGEDQQWCLISIKQKRTEFKAQNPGATNADWQADGPGDMSLDWENKEDVRLAEYYRIRQVKDTLCRLSDNSTKYRSELPDDEVLDALSLTIVAKRPTLRRRVEWFKLNGKKVVDRKVLPGKYIPVIRCEGNVLDINGKVKRKGMIQNLMDPARMFNYWRTSETERYALSPKAPWVAYEDVIEGHPEWHNANRSAFSVLVAKAATGPNGETLPLPQRAEPAPIEAGMAQAAAGAEHDLMSVAGMPQENPEVAARVMSGDKYLQRRQGMQDLTHFQYYDNQTLAIMWTGIILVDQIPHYYDTKRTQRIIGDDGRPEIVTLNDKRQEGDITHTLNDTQSGRYDVVMDTGPGYQTKREESAFKMLELLKTPLGERVAETSGDIVVRNMDFEGAQEVADRLVVTNPQALDKTVAGLPKQAQTIIGAMQKQMAAQTEQIQHLQLEVKYKGTIEHAKVEAGREKVEKDNEVKVFDIRSRDETKRDVAEIGAAGQLLNTNTEAAHDRAAATQLIDAGQTAAKKD